MKIRINFKGTENTGKKTLSLNANVISEQTSQFDKTTPLNTKYEAVIREYNFKNN